MSSKSLPWTLAKLALDELVSTLQIRTINWGIAIDGNFGGLLSMQDQKDIDQSIEA